MERVLSEHSPALLAGLIYRLDNAWVVLILVAQVFFRTGQLGRWTSPRLIKACRTRMALSKHSAEPKFITTNSRCREQNLDAFLSESVREVAFVACWKTGMPATSIRPDSCNSSRSGGRTNVTAQLGFYKEALRVVTQMSLSFTAFEAGPRAKDVQPKEQHGR